MCHNEKIKSRVNNSKYLTESELKVAISHRVRGKGGNITVQFRILVTTLGSATYHIDISTMSLPFLDMLDFLSVQKVTTFFVSTSPIIFLLCFIQTSKCLSQSARGFGGHIGCWIGSKAK
jgi:hypothetical protein